MFDDEDGPVVRTKVKICGLTNPEDAAAALEFGADALGFNFYTGSKRYVPVDNRNWIGALPGRITKVAVLVNPVWEEALSAARFPGITALQLHGSESPAFCGKLAEHGLRFAKAVPVNTPDSVKELPSFFTKTILLDSTETGAFGGTGRTFPWEIARKFVIAHPHLRVVLAGGLTPGNVAKAVAAVKPFAVDVTSGVESSPGRKDHGRLQAFIAAARGG